MFDKFLIVNQQKAGTILLDTAQFGRIWNTKQYNYRLPFLPPI